MNLHQEHHFEREIRAQLAAAALTPHRSYLVQFTRRLLGDASSADVCRQLNISEQNLFVRLHRARRVLMAA